MVGKYFKNSIFLSTVICVLIFYSGIFNINVEDSFYSFYDKQTITQISGTLDNSPVKCSNGKYYKSKLKMSEIKYKNEIKATSSGTINIFIPTELVEAFFPGKLYSSSKSNINFIFESGGVYNFDGVFSNNSFYVSSCNECIWDDTFNGKLSYIRALCRIQFKRLMYSWGKGGGLILALLSGAKEYTETEITQCFQKAGLSHILALSGMHLSLFSGIAVFLGKKAKNKRLSYLIRSLFVCFFVWFAGISPSLLRAFICSFLLFLSTIVNSENPDYILILCFSFLLQISITPNDLYNIGLILSYSALAGMLFLNSYFYKLLSLKIPNAISSSLSNSISAQIFTAPISIKYFGSFSPIGIIATVFVSPLITIFIYLSLSLILLSLLFPFISSYSAIIVNFLYTIIKYLVLIFSKVPVWSIN